MTFSSLRQRTVAAPSVQVLGVGLHSGQTVHMRIVPADSGSGLSFLRTDLEPKVTIPVRAGNVGDTLLATTLEAEGAHVSTVEHLLFTLCICGVDNAVIEIDGPEVPIMDGSAMPFLLVLRDTGLIEQEASKKFILVKKKVEVELTDQPGRRAQFEPGPAVNWGVCISYSDRVISRTSQELEHGLVDHALCVAGIASARTFGFEHEVDFLRSQQRALGGTLDNAVVLGERKVLNPNGLRLKNEFVAHKLLDVIGDCYIEGKLVVGKYKGRMPGHKLNNLLMRELLGDEDAWDEVSADDLDKDCLPDFGPLTVTL